MAGGWRSGLTNVSTEAWPKRAVGSLTAGSCRAVDG